MESNFTVVAADDTIYFQKQKCQFFNGYLIIVLEKFNM